MKKLKVGMVYAILFNYGNSNDGNPIYFKVISKENDAYMATVLQDSDNIYSSGDSYIVEIYDLDFCVPAFDYETNKDFDIWLKA